MSENNLITVKELAAKLEVTDLLLKKLIKYFEIPNQKIKRTMNLDQVAVETVKKIVELKAAGKRNKDIKQLFDEQKKREQRKTQGENSVPSNPDVKNVLLAGDKIVEIAKNEESNKALESDIDNKKESESKDEKGSENNKSSNRRKKSSKKAKQQEDFDDKTSDEDSFDGSDDKEDSEPDYIKSYIESEEQEAKYDVEQSDPVAEALALDEEDEENASDLEDFDDVEEEEELSKDSLSPRKIKRKAFSFRYIQRQIASDTKKVNFLKNKLKKGKLSHLERLNLKDSLDRRAKMLSSWIQILRWVKS